MLAHGFVDRQHHEDFTLDESDPMSYSVVRLHAGRASLTSIGAVVLVLAVAAAVLLLV